MNRPTFLVVAASVLVAGIFFGRAMQSHADGPCGVPPGNCLDGPPPDGSSMAGVLVYHSTSNDPEVQPDVEPNTTDSWQITAQHSTPNVPGSCNCQQYYSNITADVTWTGSGWNVTCSGCNSVNGPIMSVAVCSEVACQDGMTLHGTGYRLVARVAQTRPQICGVNAAHLTAVTFQTTSVDNGRDLNDCVDSGAVTPDSQSWQATDYAFSCNLSCSTVVGPTIRITYQ